MTLKLLVFSVAFFGSTTLLFGQFKLDLNAKKQLAIFSEDFISDGLGNRDMAISPDEKEMFYTIQHKNGLYSCLMHLKKSNETWSVPSVAIFSGLYNDLEPAFSPDGKKLFFTSNRPKNDSAKSADYDIWAVDKIGDTWGIPYNLGTDVNSKGDDFYPSVAKNGNLYFTRNNGNNTTKEDIVVCRFKNNKYELPETLPETINSPGYEFNAFIDPEEKFLIYSAFKRKDDTGGGDLYISFNNNGKWEESKNLGPLINSSVLDYCPFVSPDGKTFFFSSARHQFNLPITAKQRSNIIKLLNSAGNGYDDIYYINFEEVLKSLR